MNYFFTDGLPGYHEAADMGHDERCPNCRWYRERCESCGSDEPKAMHDVMGCDPKEMAR